jgi:hypothetical protein
VERRLLIWDEIPSALINTANKVPSALAKKVNLRFPNAFQESLDPDDSGLEPVASQARGTDLSALHFLPQRGADGSRHSNA